LGPIPNPQSPIPNPQSPIPYSLYQNIKLNDNFELNIKPMISSPNKAYLFLFINKS